MIQSFYQIDNPGNHRVTVDGAVVGYSGQPPFSTNPKDWVEEPYVTTEAKERTSQAPGSQALYDYYIGAGQSPADAARLSNFTP